MDGYSTGNVNIPSSISPLDFASLYAPQQPQQGMPLPMSYGMGQPQNVPMAPVDQNFQVPYQQPQQPPPELQHVTDVLTQYIQSKQDQQNNNGLTEQLLAQRFQPQMQDIGRSITQTAQAYGAPDLFKPLDPYQAASQRANSELAPYTTSLDLASKQVGLQNAQIQNQFLPQKEQANIDLMKAQALMASGGGLFSGNGQSSANMPHGDEFLQTMSPAMAATVKGIAEGRQQAPSGFIMKTPFGQQLMAAVSQYDPTFDAVNYGARFATRKDFTAGPSANNITALNTAMAHLKSLSDSFGNLHNTDYPMLNQATNYLGNQFGNQNIQSNTAAVGVDAEAVSHELAKVFRSTGMSEGEIDAWKEKINANASPPQMKAVIQSAIDLMNGRMQALSERYNQGMGTTKQGMELLSPQAQNAYNQLSGNPQSANPSSGLSSSVQEGATATNPQTGQKIVFKNGQWGAL